MLGQPSAVKMQLNLQPLRGRLSAQGKSLVVSTQDKQCNFGNQLANFAQSRQWLEVASK